MSKKIFLAISVFYAIGLLLAGLVYLTHSEQIIAIAAVLPEISLLFYLILLLKHKGRNIQLVLTIAGMTSAIFSTFLVVYYAENEGSAFLASFANAFRIILYLLSFGYVANVRLNVKTLKNIGYWSFIGGTLVVLLPAFYLIDLDEKGYKMVIILQYAFSYAFLIQSLRRYSLVSWKAYLFGVGSVLGFVLSDTLFGFAEYHGMPLSYEFSHIIYFAAQYLFILSIQFQYTSRRWVHPSLHY